MADSSPQRLRIGYALPSKKQLTFIKPSLTTLAAARGIDLVPIDPARPIADQGPFHCVIHKLYTTDWYSNLRSYSLHHPNVPVVDPPAAIEPLHDRVSMLKSVSDLDIPNRKETIGIPNQVVIRDPLPLSDLTLNFPAIAKPLVANGSLGSHTMSLVLSSAGLRHLQPPVVLQEFVNHGGVIFKVYVVGDYVDCVKRKSLPDISDEQLNPSNSEGVISFSRVSNSAMAKEEEKKFEDARMPAMDFVVEIARGLRRATGLNLFNFDMIRDAKEDAEHYLVIDINYFPGYEKITSYESVMTDFFLHVALKGKEDVGGSDGGDETQKK